MGFTRDDFSELQDRQRKAKVLKQAGQLQQLAMALPPMERLTGDPNWDLFLKVGQALMEASEKVVGESGAAPPGEQAGAPTMVNENELLDETLPSAR